MDAETLRAQYNRDGYVLVPGALSQERVHEIRNQIMTKVSDAPIERVEPHFISEPYKKPPEERRDGTLFLDTYCRFPEFIDVIANPKTVEALKALLGNDYLLLPDDSVYFRKFGPLHKDTSTEVYKGLTYHSEADYRIVTVGLYLQPNDEHGGGLFVIPGSHLDPFDPVCDTYKKQESYYKSFWRRIARKLSFGKLFAYEKLVQSDFGLSSKGVDIQSQPGDVVIFDFNLLHRSSFPTVEEACPLGGRIAFFSRCSVNNRHAKTYVEYLKTKGQLDEFFAQGERDTKPLESAAKESGFNLYSISK